MGLPSEFTGISALLAALLATRDILSGMRKMYVRAGILFVIALIAVRSQKLVAQEAHFPTNEDLRHTRGIGQPRLSPDAQSVLIQVPDATADGGRSHLWLVDIKQNAAECCAVGAVRIATRVGSCRRISSLMHMPLL